jgi:hypothetical protein
MKPIKSFSSKIAILLLVLGSVAIFYWYWCHKNFDEKSIAQNTDGIVLVDVKNIRNYFILSCLKNPSQWKLGTTKTKKKFDLSNFGIETPDYLAFFHLENQPISQWFAVAKIENETDFVKAMTKENFSKKTLQNGINVYYSKHLNICITKQSSQILFAFIPEKQIEIAAKVAEDLFLKKLFFDAEKIEKTNYSKNAITIWIKKNRFLEKDGIVAVNLENEEILAQGQIQLKAKYKKESQFSQNPNTLLSLGFNFEFIQNQEFITKNSAKINKMIGFDLDSILMYRPTKTELLLNEMIEKRNSAVSYDYDDDFNPIKKVVVHSSREPSFYFSIQTDNSQKVFDYLKGKNAIDNHQVFVNFPLAETKTFVKNKALAFEANLPQHNYPRTSRTKIAYLRINFEKLQAKDWRYLIAKNKGFRFLKPFEILETSLTNENNFGHFRARLKTRNKQNLITVLK